MIVLYSYRNHLSYYRIPTLVDVYYLPPAYPCARCLVACLATEVLVESTNEEIICLLGLLTPKP